jgi:hypothetical protein
MFEIIGVREKVFPSENAFHARKKREDRLRSAAIAVDSSGND